MERSRFCVTARVSFGDVGVSARSNEADFVFLVLIDDSAAEGLDLPPRRSLRTSIH